MKEKLFVNLHKVTFLSFNDMSRELFSGHTPREQWIFFNHSVWFASAFVLFLANSTIRSMYYPFVSIINVFASLAHWSTYNPKSIA